MRRRLNLGWSSTNSETDEHDQENLQCANDFTSMNNIYELQSAINKLSIEKQKNYIAYTIAIKEQQEIVEGYEQIVAQLRNKIDETERELRSEKSRADFSEAQIKNIESKRKNLEDKFGQIVETIDGSISYNLIISNYNQARIQVMEQTQQIKKLKNHIEQFSQQNQNLAMELDCTKKCMETQLKQMRQRLENQANSFNQKYSILALESNSQMLKKAERESKLEQSITQLQEQNKNLLGKIASYRSQLQQLKNVHIQNQILKLQNQSKTELGYRDKYKEIKQKLESLLQQKNKLIEELRIKQKQNLILIQSNEKNVQQYANLQRQVLLTKQINQKIQQKMGEFDIQSEPKKRQPSDKLARLDELTAIFKIQREKLQGQLNVQKRTIAHLEKKVEEKQEQVQHLEISNQKSQELIMILERSNQSSKNSIVNLQKQNSNIKIKLVQLEQKLSRKQTQLLIHQKQNSSQIPKSNKIKMNVQKYESLMLSLTNLGKEKSITDKQLLRIKNQLKFTQSTLEQKIRKNNEYEHLIGRLQDKIRRLQAEINQGIEQIKKLEQQMEEKRLSKEKDYKQFVEKTELMSQCINQLKKWKMQYEKKQVKNSGFKLINEAVRIKIGHQQINELSKVKIKQLNDRKQKKREVESKGKLKGKEQYCSTNCQVILVRPRIKSQMIKGNKEMNNGENKNSQDQKLDRTIKQLKKQKQSLVSNKII